MSHALRITLLILAVCILSAGQVWLSHIRVDVSEQVAQLKQERNAMKQDVQNLSLEVASLLRPDTLRRLAREKMGMHAPTPMQVVKP